MTSIPEVIQTERPNDETKGVTTIDSGKGRDMRSEHTMTVGAMRPRKRNQYRRVAKIRIALDRTVRQ
jgi:hypothetical protein